MRLTAGSYVYKTCFTLPENLPESYECGVGHIRYEAKVHVELPWDFDVKETTCFYIKPHYNLNDFPHLRDPVCAKEFQTFSFCFWWQPKPSRMYISLPRSGFVPGDRVQCTLVFNNESAVPIHVADMKLVQRIIYGISKTTLKWSRTLWSHRFTGNNGHHLVSAMQNKECTVDLYFDPLWEYHYFTSCQIVTVTA